ncbi:MAG: sugar phosphate isomerase/epimerase [Deltaproteobacteria bacterium]|nr:sugar phosphate isomerase/epimerase [Deltaproteobacteria bacterium]
MNKLSRRDLLKTSALAATALPFASLDHFAEQAAPAAADPWRGLKIGVATYTVRELPIEEAIKGVQRSGLKYISIKNVKNHVDLSHTPEERKQRTQMFRDAGLVPLSVGNVSMRTGEADIRKAFDYARDVGVTTIVCAPSPDALPILDKLVKEFDMKLAIHNHGPEDKGFFPSPYDVWKAVEKYDKRIGLCIDVGHTARAGVDPAEAILKCRERLYDLHLKDISALGNRNTPIEAGRGIPDLKAILAALLKINYQGLAGFEYEKDGKDPVPGLAESVGYVKGLLVAMK